MFANLTWVVQMIAEHPWLNLVLDVAVKGTLILLAAWLLSLLPAGGRRQSVIWRGPLPLLDF